ncbi:MAG: insulinase family protein [Acidobacteriota bacterium]|nr:insulinase family protein [Acidobacteriota bacterium]
MTRPIAVGLIVGVLAFAAAPSPPEFHIPFERYKLANGLRVVLARDNSIPVAAVYLIFDAGGRTEDKGTFGYAHLIARLMFEGSRNLKKGEYERLIHANGGTYSGADRLDYSEYSSAMPSNMLPLALWMEAERLRNPDITAEKLKSAKDSIRAGKTALLEQPYRDAMLNAWRQTVFSDPRDRQTAFTGPGDVESATVGQVTSVFHSWYSPSNAALVVAGDFDTAQLKKSIDLYFAGLPAAAPPKHPAISEPERAEGIHTEVADPHARFPAVIVGWPAPRRSTPEWHALELLDAILTQGRDSKLEIEMMRGRQSILQADENVGWPTSTALDYKDPGYFAAMFIYKPTFTAMEIARQYEDILSSIALSGLDSQEFLRARAAFRYARATAAQSALGRAQLLGIHEILDGDAAAAERDYAAVIALSIDQVRSAITKYLTEKRADIVSIKPGTAAPAGNAR